MPYFLYSFRPTLFWLTFEKLTNSQFEDGRGGVL